jgi:hypothetical protein
LSALSPLAGLLAFRGSAPIAKAMGYFRMSLPGQNPSWTSLQTSAIPIRFFQ